MYLEHVNLVVNNMEKTLAFYQVAFPHWRIRSQGESKWYEYKRKWLHFGDDEQYIAFSNHGVGENRNLAGNQVGLAHFAYVTSNIHDTISRLEAAGFSCSVPLKVDGVRKNAYFIDPDGFEIEFIEYNSDLPHERNKN